MAISRNIEHFLFRGVSSAPLVAFRMIFGALMLFGSIRFLLKGWVYEMYIAPEFHFTYLGFDWVQPLPGNWMYLPFLLMVVASSCIVLGWHYRFSALLFFLCFTYVELLDKTNYLNHYYFVSLTAFLMILVPANADFSLDARRKKRLQRENVPAWTILILQLQLAMVYVFAGVAKLNSDWLLEAQPLKIWLQAHRDLPLAGGLLATAWVAFAFSWFGCIYDLTIPFFLSFRKTRPFAYFFVIVFHVFTWLLFPIGVFPWVMIFSTLIFFPAAFHHRWIKWLKRLTGYTQQQTGTRHYFPVRPQVVIFLSLFLLIQITVPFRYLLYPGNLFWTEEGFRFSWRVMLMHKEGYATFYIVDKTTGGSIEIDNTRHLTPAQIDQMATQPDMILQYAHHLGYIYRDTVLTYGTQSVHLHRPSVEAEIFVSLNGRPHRLFVGRKTDLMNETYNLKHRTWLEPFGD